MHLRARLAFRAAPQHAFEHDLRDVVGNFRRRPIGIRPRQSAELMPAEPRHIGGGARNIVWQSLGAQFVGDAEPPEVLHRARIGVVALGMLGGLGLLGDQDVRNAAPRQLDRSRRDRPARRRRSAQMSPRPSRRSLHREICAVTRCVSACRPCGAPRTRRRDAGLPGRCRGRCRARDATRPARRARPARSRRGTAPAAE